MNFNLCVMPLAMLGLCWVTGCKSPQGETSEYLQIFSDQQRERVEPANYPFILASEGCTAFVIDHIEQIAISAAHCEIEMGEEICHGGAITLFRNGKAICPNSGKVTEIIENSRQLRQAWMGDFGNEDQIPVPEVPKDHWTPPDQDFVIFKFKVAKPERLTQSIKLARSAPLKEMFENRIRLEQIGFPGDKYQKGYLTRSLCRVRHPEAVSIKGFSYSGWFVKAPEQQQLIRAWYSRSEYHSRRDFKEMRKVCSGIRYFSIYDQSTENVRFINDCSTYGGNSGGPILVGNIAVGMPAGYFPDPESATNHFINPQVACYEKYWNDYFFPILNAPAPSREQMNESFKKKFIGFDRLDRRLEDLDSFPRGILMQEIIAQSKWLQEHQQYSTPYTADE